MFGVNAPNGVDEAKLKDGSYTVEVWTKRGSPRTLVRPRGQMAHKTRFLKQRAGPSGPEITPKTLFFG